MISRALIVFALLVSLLPVGALATEITLYGPDSAHPANKLHQTLFVRTGFDGRDYGADRVDPLYWQGSRFLLESPSLETALSALMNFLNLSDQELRSFSIRQRAVLQRDLWATFDSVSERLARPNPEQTKLLMALAAGIHRLALNAQELAHLNSDLGEPYSKTLKRNGWVEIGSEHPHPVATAHAVHFGGRSTSLVLMHAGSNEETIAYLRTLYAFPDPLLKTRDPMGVPEINPNLPKLAPRTQFVFARFANLIRNDGQIVPTPIFEVFQMMQVGLDNKWKFARAEFSRAKFFSAQRNGLIGVTKDAEDFPQLLSSPQDPFENRGRWFKQNILKSCDSCHLPNITGVESYIRDFQVKIKTPRVDLMVPQQNSVQFELTRAFKESDPNWKRLQSALF